MATEMPYMTVEGLTELVRDLEKFADLPANVSREMVDAKAVIMEKALIFRAGGMLTGPYYVGDVVSSIKRKRARGTRNVIAKITFDGLSSHGSDKGAPVRNAEIAFVNEYGARGKAARPFITTAIKEADGYGNGAAADVLEKWKNKNNL